MYFNFNKTHIDNSTSNNYYTLLGVNKNATTEEIKKAYRKLSLSFHPDRNGSDIKKSQTFCKMTDAYNILSDPDKRRNYDIELSISQVNLNPSIIHNMMLNNQDEYNLDYNNFLFNHDKKNLVNVHHKIPETIFKDLSITLLQSFEGCKIPVNIKKWRIENNRKIDINETIYIDIPKGIDNGEIIRLDKKGNSSNENNIGDVEIKIEISIGDSFFSREGLDLIYKKDITLKESFCGFSFDIRFLDGKEIKINNKAGNIIPPYFRKVIKNMGFERDNIKGNLVILFNVIYPKELSVEQIRNLNDIL